jgi:hypothetical protein
MFEIELRSPVANIHWLGHVWKPNCLVCTTCANPTLRLYQIVFTATGVYLSGCGVDTLGGEVVDLRPIRWSCDCWSVEWSGDVLT